VFSVIIIETSIFTRQVTTFLSDDRYRAFQIALVNRHDLGSIIPGSGGLRKVRWGLAGKGKRGSIRMIYYWAVLQERIIMLYLYPKNVRDDMTPAQISILRRIIEEEYP
jgi:hypothetical protein